MEKEKREINDNTNNNDLIIWIKTHKTQLIITGISILSLITIIAGEKNKEAIKKLFEGLREGIENVNLYSSDWFTKATDVELDSEREKVQLAYCSAGDNFNEACKLQNLLWRFDKEMSRRVWGDKVTHTESIHREHGWYLSNDD